MMKYNLIKLIDNCDDSYHTNGPYKICMQDVYNEYNICNLNFDNVWRSCTQAVEHATWEEETLFPIVIATYNSINMEWTNIFHCDDMTSLQDTLTNTQLLEQLPFGELSNTLVDETPNLYTWQQFEI